MTWAMPPVGREPLVLFPTALEEVVPQDHLVRVLAEILRALDWSEFEVKYHRQLGARPIHPRVLTSVILHGHLTRRGRAGSSKRRCGVAWTFAGRRKGSRSPLRRSRTSAKTSRTCCGGSTRSSGRWRIRWG